MITIPLLLWQSEIFKPTMIVDIEKTSAYECGFEPFDLARSLIDIQFYIVAILFLVFDIEIIFLLPWAVCFSTISLIGLWSVIIFISLLIIGLIYEIQSGALNWAETTDKINYNLAFLSFFLCDIDLIDIFEWIELYKLDINIKYVEHFHLVESLMIIVWIITFFSLILVYYFINKKIIFSNNYIVKLNHLLASIFVWAIVLMVAPLYLGELIQEENEWFLQLDVWRHQGLVYWNPYLISEGWVDLDAFKLGNYTVSQLNYTPLFNIMKILLYLIAFLALHLSSIYALNYKGVLPPEYPVLLLTLIVSLQIIGLACNILVLIIAIELVSLCLFVLIGQSRYSLEAALKYFAFSAFTTVFFLIGVLFSYVSVNSLDFYAIQTYIANLSNQDMKLLHILWPGVFLVGFLFKLAAFPCSMWAPDVYQGSINPIAFTIATLTKLGFFIGFIQLFITIFFHLSQYWQPILIFSSATSLIIGALGALRQDRIKRFLAFTSMHQMGFVLAALTCDLSGDGPRNSIIYFITYIITLGGFFALYLLYTNKFKTQPEFITDFTRINMYAPRASWSITYLCVFLFSMAGIPPFIGFFTKYLIFIQLFENYVWALFFLAVCTSIISIYNYLRIVKVLLFNNYTISGIYEYNQYKIANTVSPSIVSLAIFPMLIFQFIVLFIEWEENTFYWLVVCC
jgi:NADH-quinone oxidoreductase subunit N